MAGEYAILAPHYDRIGMNGFAARITPRLLNFAQQNGWMGRRILDLGCGTGACLTWLAGHGYSGVGVDSAPEMLQQARGIISRNNLNATLVEGDIRALERIDRIDMAVALGVMNEMENLRDLETVFKWAHEILVSGRFFVFDMLTIEGLTECGGVVERRDYEDQDLIVFSRTRYDFERQLGTIDYDLFEKTEAQEWQRKQTRRVLRAYPVQAVVSLLRRQNFEIVSVVNAAFDPVDLAASGATQVIFFAKQI